jgi:HK97 family phage portal protein
MTTTMTSNQVTIYRPNGTVIDASEIQAIRETRDERVPQLQRIATRIRTQAGVIMTADRAMTISTVWACIRFLAQGVAKPDWRVKQQTGTNSEIKVKHPVDWILNRRASKEWSSFQFRETMMHWALRQGNAFAEIERAIDNRVVALWPIHPSRVTVMRDPVTWELFYDVAGNDGVGTVRLEANDVFHLRGLGEGPVGLNVMAYAAQSLGWVKAAQMFGASFFGHGAQLAGVVTMKKTLSPEALAELRADFQKLYGGPTGSNNTAFLDNEMDYKSIGVEPEKGQFIETNEFLIDEVCRWFGVPPHKVYNLKRATFSNIEHQSIEVVEDSLKPWVKRLQDEADFKLFGDNRSNLYTEIDLKKLLRPDTATRMQYFQGLRNIGAMNADEIRDEEGLNEIGAAKGGQKYTLQAGFTTLEKIGEEPPAPAPGAPGAPAPGEDPDEPDEDEEPAEEADPVDEPDAEAVARRNRVFAMLNAGEFETC